MIALLLLGISVCVGLSNGEQQVEYGVTYKMYLNTLTDSIEFKPKDRSSLTLLWKKNDPSVSRNDARRQVTDSYLIIKNLTQRDSGRYVMRDSNNHSLHTRTLEVTAKQEFYTLNPGEKLSVAFDLEPRFCYIYFFPTRGYDEGESSTFIVHQGNLQRRLDRLDCAEFSLLEPCGILMRALQMSCSGRFEVRDQYNDQALVVNLQMQEIPKDPLYTAIGVSAAVAAIIGCCCMRSCCCRKGSSDKDDCEIPADPAVNPREYIPNPVRPGLDQPSQPLMPLYPVPSYTPTNPLVHNPPTGNAANVEVPAPADAATARNSTDTEPRFELKGMNFPMTLPLSSDSTYQDVYTSDKLNLK